MVADPGDFSGSAEAKYYNENLEASDLLHRDGLCQNSANPCFLLLMLIQHRPGTNMESYRPARVHLQVH